MTLEDKKSPIKRKKNRQETIDLLLKSALDIFSDMGFEAATTKMVATKANVSEALITRYFKSKQGLLEEVIDYVAKLITLTPLPYEQQPTLEQEIINYLILRNRLHHHHKNFFKLCYSRISMDKKLGKKMIKALLNGTPIELLKRLEHFQKRGDIQMDISLNVVLNNLLMQMTGSFIMGEMMLNLSQKEIEEHLKLAGLAYAQGIKTQTRGISINKTSDEVSPLISR